MPFPISTGEVARLLQTPEHRVVNPIRLGKLAVPTMGNRRLWYAEQVLAVARIIGKDSLEIRRLCAGRDNADAK